MNRLIKKIFHERGLIIKAGLKLEKSGEQLSCLLNAGG
jgi:hypothetical protein